MSRLINKRIDVRATSFGVPVGLAWGNREIEIEAVVEEWKQVGRWWRGEQGSRYLIVISRDKDTYELCETGAGKWKLIRIYD